MTAKLQYCKGGKFIEYLQEYKDLYTKEEYKELLALWREDYNKYLRGLIGED